MPINFSISSHDFRNNYQERKPFLMPGALPVDAVTWRDVNGIVERANVASDDFKISYDGIRPKGEYIESWWDIGTLRHRLIRSVVYDYMQKGATLISNKIYGEEKVSQISNEISNFTARQVVSSVYVAFGDRSSFKCHWDTRDVFAVQIIGRKRWLIYKPSFEFPLYTQQSKDYGHLYPCPDSPYMDVILEPGDILYLPRGWWHDPLPLGEPTVHIALGTFPAYTMDYLCWSVNQMQNNLHSRRSLSEWKEDYISLTSVVKQMNEFIFDRDNYERFLNEFTAGSRVESPLSLEVFGNPSAGPLPDIATFFLNSNKAHGLDKNYIIANGTKLSMDDSGAELIRFITDHPRATLAEIIEHSGTPEAQIRELITQLCRNDILGMIF